MDLLTETLIRRASAARASALVPMGLGVRKDEFLEFIAPMGLDGPTLQLALGHVWCCALTIEGLMRAGGIEEPELDRKYINGEAMAVIELVAQRRGAWRRYVRGGELPGQGDHVIVMHAGGHVFTLEGDPWQAGDDGEPGHVAIDFISRDASKPWVSPPFTTVEGGQSITAAAPAIDRRSRKLIEEDGTLYCGSGAEHGSLVFGWISCSALYPAPAGVVSGPAAPLEQDGPVDPRDTDPGTGPEAA